MKFAPRTFVAAVVTLYHACRFLHLFVYVQTINVILCASDSLSWSDRECQGLGLCVFRSLLYLSSIELKIEEQKRG